MNTRNPWLWAFAAVVLVFGLSAFDDSEYDSYTCEQLTGAMLMMTGVPRSEPYDLDKVREINAARTDKGCWAQMRS